MGGKKKTNERIKLIRRRSSVTSPATSAGRVASVVLPIPSCPLLLLPQHLTPPPLTTAHVWEPPTAMGAAVVPAGGENDDYGGAKGTASRLVVAVHCAPQATNSQVWSMC